MELTSLCRPAKAQLGGGGLQGQRSPQPEPLSASAGLRQNQRVPVPLLSQASHGGGVGLGWGGNLPAQRALHVVLTRTEVQGHGLTPGTHTSFSKEEYLGRSTGSQAILMCCQV